MARQTWIYLLPEDLEPLFALIDGVDPGLLALPGQPWRGAPESVPAASESLQPAAAPELREQRWHLFHRAHSRTCAAADAPEVGQGAWRVDERRSDCLTLRVPGIRAGSLEPGRLTADAQYAEGGRAVRKPAAFGEWAGKVTRELARLPATSVGFIHLAPGAARAAREGSLKLMYLSQEVALRPAEPRTPVHKPQHRRGKPRG